MGSKKKFNRKAPDNTISAPDPVSQKASAPKSRVVRACQVLSALLFILILYRTYTFYHTGYSGYFNTLIFYAFFICASLAFIPTERKTLRVNAVVILLILFAAENYLRFSGKGFLNYTEKNNHNPFTPYISASNDYQKTGFIPGLWVDEPNHEFLYQVNEFSYMHRHNETGLRERPAAQFRNERTIIVLGDSFTYGVGAPEDSTGVVSLEKHLAARGIDVLCYNGGSSGSDICFSWKLYEQALKKLKPEVVILNINRTDIQDIVFRGGDERFRDGGVTFRDGHWYQFPYSWSYIFRVILAGASQDGEDEAANLEKQMEAIDIIKNKISDFRQLAQRDSFKLVVVFTPMAVEVKYGRLSLENVLLETELRYPDIFVFDYLNFLKSSRVITPENLNAYYYRTDLHFRPAGYWIWGQALADTLVGKGVVK